ncbi:hypothetical protein M501DRAFT_999857 [Patellaria atrata CBS 101060]|uniref:Histidine kinase n=1 Tax=Patellaria atrata CBS 101060 TaxID=1346257 RepID=A0A9P4S206_9PEZI|nr:hypothetical protein M501DRAFT_999857 [Patellaria atrata CBS 101060]
MEDGHCKFDGAAQSQADPTPSHCLKSFVTFVKSLPHPAAIYWGDEHALHQNNKWESIMDSDDEEEGRSQKDSLSDEALEALRSILETKPENRMTSTKFERRLKDGRVLPVTVSPIWDTESDTIRGAVAQILANVNFLNQSLQPPAEKLENANADAETKSNPQKAGKGSPDVGQPQEIEKTSPDVGQPQEIQKRSSDAQPFDLHPFFHRFAEMLPVGIAILDRDAQAVFVNTRFWTLTTNDDANKQFQGWPESIHEEDYDSVMGAYREAFAKGQQMQIEFRSQGQSTPWRLLLLTPLGDEELKHVSLKEHGGFICAIVDITSNKAAELAQKKNADEAQERKEQQERFIDMISHEIRNPLSAVLHCAEDILEIVQSRHSGDDSPYTADIIEAAKTINICVMHQKNIVDDILSFSKLDSAMLSLSPKSIRPKEGVANALKMFQTELRKQGIDFKYSVDISYQDCMVEWVKADEVRVVQVLTNLMTNAIKFTAKTDGDKKIFVAIGASQQRPTSYPPSVVFFDTDDSGYRMDGTLTSEWGNGETLYLMVAVKDTGIGISAEDQAKLFERFRQATPKTSEIYGGSGLGLNISRKLCQLHGGEIGVSSKLGEGSTFGYFIKVRRTDAPADPDGQFQHATDYLCNTAGKKVAPISIQPIEDEEVPESLKDPPVENVTEAKPETGSTFDNKAERYQETAKVASHVEQHTDEYNINERPDIPSSHKSSYGEGRDSPLGSASEKTNNGRPRILVVEDNVINQKILRRKLESKGYAVTTANNGREGVNTVIDSASNGHKDTLPFECILMDQEMPVMDGNAATKGLREWERKEERNRIPVLGVTANVREEQKQDMMDSGMDDIIHKPYKIEEMVDKIGRLRKG